MWEWIWFICKLFLIIIVILSILHAIVTHFVMWYEARVQRVLYGEEVSIEEPLTWPEIIISFFVEIFCNFIRFFLYPFASQNYKFISSNSNPQAPPILLVHGYLQNQMDWLWIRKKLQQTEGIGPIYSINLLPHFESIASLAALLKNKVQEIKEETQQNKVILIGHSMGGLVSSYYAEYLADPNEVAMVITLSSPFKGTRLVVFGSGKNIKEMSPNSSFLKELTQKIQNSSLSYYHIGSKMDNVIVPWQSSFPFDLQNNKNLKNNNSNNTTTLHNNNISSNHLILKDHGHLRVLISPKVINQIREWLKPFIIKSS